MMKPLLFLLLLLQKTWSLSQCPPQCACADGNIVCTCESTANSELSISSLGGAFARSFVVHSCARVTIQNGSFHGVVLQDRLTFVGVERLIIEPHAFKGILQSPKQFVIEQCGIPRLLPGAFEGLSRLQHIWFRKTSIDTIENGAFFAVGPVDYLYFRDCTLAYVQRSAFGGIRHAKHLFFRGGVRIADTEGELFKNSSIGEIVFDDVIGHLHEGFLLGSSAPVVINNSSMHFQSRGETFEGPQELSESFAISESRLNHFAPLLFSNYRLIEIIHTKIGRLRGADSQIQGGLSHPLRLHLEDCDIGSVEPFAFSHSRLSEIRIRDSRMGNWTQTAFTSSRIGHLSVEDSKILEIQGGTFSGARIDRISMIRSKISKIAAKAWDRSFIRRFETKKTDFRNLGEGIFSKTEILNVSVEDSLIVISTSRPWKESKISAAAFRQCEFIGTMRRSFFDGLTAVRLSISGSRFACDERDCELNAMLFAPLRENLLWTFEMNSCDTNVTRGPVCTEPSISDFGSLRCQRTASVADCVCTGPSARLPLFDAQLLVLGDCDELIIDDQSGNHPTILYLYRISKCEVAQAPSSLRAAHIYHSSVVLRPGVWGSRRLERFWLEKSRLTVEDGALHHAEIGSWRLQDSYLTGLSDVSLEGTQIEQLTINASRLEAAGPLIQRTSRLSLVDSVLGSADGLTGVRFAHLANNTILCCCSRRRDCVPTPLQCRQEFPQAKCPAAFASRYNSVALFHFFPTILVPVILRKCPMHRVGSFGYLQKEYEVTANMEVQNATIYSMELTDYDMEHGTAVNPPMNIPPRHVLCCGFHKINWAPAGVRGTITWKLGENTTITVEFFVHYNHILNYDDNELRIEIVSNGSSNYHNICGDRLCHATNGTITFNGTIGNANHSTIQLSVSERTCNQYIYERGPLISSLFWAE